MDIPVTQLPPGDPRLVEAIVGQLKSKGIFDQFRKECLADVDTKPAFQNLRQRVEGQVNKYLDKQIWKNDMNKNTMREGVRKHVNELGILESGIDAIITQVVNPKIKPLILPYVEDTVYTFLQIDKPKRGIAEPEPEPEPEAEPESNPVNQQVHHIIEYSHGNGPEHKAALMPSNTEMVSSEEDEILARESPPSARYTAQRPQEIKNEDENARDGFGMDTNARDGFGMDTNARDGFGMDTDSPETDVHQDTIVSNVEKLKLEDTYDESGHGHLPSNAGSTKAPLQLFDNQSLDSISSNSSGLSSPKAKQNSSQEKQNKPVETSSRHEESMDDEPLSRSSTPLVDEKSVGGMDEASNSLISSGPSHAISPIHASIDKMTASPHSIPGEASPTHSAAGNELPEKENMTFVSGASPISQDEDSRISGGSFSRVSVASEKSDIDEMAKSEKSEGEITSSSSESGESDKKSKILEKNDIEERTNERDDTQKSEDKESLNKSSSKSSTKDHKQSHRSHSREREKDRDKDSSRHSKDKDSKDKDKERKSSKSRDDHHSHRDKDKKHHRKDKDHDGDRDKSHHHSSSSSHRDGSGSSSSKSGDKEKSSHKSSGDKSEGQSRRGSSHEKSDRKHSSSDSKSSDKKSSSDKHVSSKHRRDSKDDKSKSHRDHHKHDSKERSNSSSRHESKSSSSKSNKSSSSSSSGNRRRHSSDSRRSESRSINKEKSVSTDKPCETSTTVIEIEKPNTNIIQFDKEISIDANMNIKPYGKGKIILFHCEEENGTSNSNTETTDLEAAREELSSLFDSDDEMSDFEGFENYNIRSKSFDDFDNIVPDFEGFENILTDKTNLKMIICEKNLKGKVTMEDFLQCCRNLGATVKDVEDVTQTLQVKPFVKGVEENEVLYNSEERTKSSGKKRRYSTSSSASSQSPTGSPKHKRMKGNSVTQLVENNQVMVSGYALLTPEDDGNRTSSRDYEVDYSQRENSYSPLSPASDSSADDRKLNQADMSNKESSCRLKNAVPEEPAPQESVKSPKSFKNRGKVIIPI